MSAPSRAPRESPGRPGVPVATVLRIYTIYRFVLLALYAGMVAVGAWAYATGIEPEAGGPQMGLAIAALGLLFGGCVAGSFRLPRAPWAWSLHGAVIGFGVCLCAPAPLAALLLYAWLAPDVRAHFSPGG